MIPSGKKLTEGRLFPVEEMKLTKADLWTSENFLPRQNIVDNYSEKGENKLTKHDFYTKTLTMQNNLEENI